MSRIHSAIAITVALMVACTQLVRSAPSSSYTHRSYYHASLSSHVLPSLHHPRYQRIHLQSAPRDREHTMRVEDANRETAEKSEPTYAHQFEQTFPYLTFLIRVKVPFTRSCRSALESYLSPFQLGSYIPHHSFLVSVGHDGTAYGGRADALRHPPVDPAASEHPLKSELATHPANDWTESQVLQWLQRAPGVVYATRRTHEHTVHPKIAAAVNKLTFKQKHQSDQTVEEIDWTFEDFTPIHAKRKWKKSLDATTADSSTASHVADASAFHIVSLSVSLTPHPELQHDPSQLIRHIPGSVEHHTQQAFEKQAMTHTIRVLQQWKKHLLTMDWTAHLSSERSELIAASSSSRLVVHVHGSPEVLVDAVAATTPDSASPQVLSHTESISALLSHPLTISLLAVTPTQVRVHCSSWILLRVINFLSTRLDVSWIAPTSQQRIMNKFIRTIIQSDSNVTSVWDKGLKGEGQTVQLGDTGLDYDSCAFYDPARPVPVNSVDLSHRKISTYTLFETADAGDDPDGHGTHVGGSLAGAVQDANVPMAQFNGQAPAAKLAFYDFKKSGSEELLVPLSVYKPYLGHAYQNTGARVSSNSWGSPDGEYGSYCRELDQFAFDFSDFLIVFAAGNYGEQGWNSISSPGVSKNVLTVGSTKTSSASFFDAGLDWGFLVSGSGFATLDEHPGVSISEANFGVKFATLSLQDGMVLVADPIDGCESLKNAVADLSAAQVILVRRGTCHFGVKASNVQASGNGATKLLIVVNNEEGPAAHMAGEPGQENFQWTLSAVMVGKTIGESIISASLAQRSSDIPGNNTLRITAPIEVDPPDENERVLSSFSSRGPTFGGRLKPDILAPGEFVRSVRSDGVLNSVESCPSDLSKALLQLEGTSMATPMIAASAALVRQWLQEGFYPSGQRASTDAMEKPPSSLVKALLIHSGISTSGTVLTKRASDTVARTETVTPAPSYFQGFGRVLLDSVIRFASASGSGSGDASDNPFISSPLTSVGQLPNIALLGDSTSSADSMGEIDQDDVHSYCFLVSPTQPPTSSNTFLPFLRATLTWTDPPVGEGAAFVLVNNLDLFVTLPAGSNDPLQQQVFLGNGFAFTDAQGIHQQWDLENNVEQVSLWNISQPVSGNSSDPTALVPILVHVRGTSVPEAGQKYSLVVTGWFHDHINATTGKIEKQVELANCIMSGQDGASTIPLNHPLSILCPNNCGLSLGRGKCTLTSGLCECENDWTGSDCSIRSVWMIPDQDEEWVWNVPVSSGSTDTAPFIPITSDGWSYFSFSPLDFHSSVDEFLSAISHIQSLRITMTRVSTDGDPDLFVGLRTFPTLRSHDLADTQCDSCLGVGAAAAGDGSGGDGSTTSVPVTPGPSHVDISVEKLLSLESTLRADPFHRIRIGVHGYCCDDSVVTLTIQAVRPPSPPSIWLWLAPLLVMLLLCTFVAFMARRKRRRTEQGLDRMPLPVAHAEGDMVPLSDLRRPASPSQTMRGTSTSGVRGQFMSVAAEEAAAH